MADGIDIKGGRYNWVDTHDGYKTILDVPLVASFTKGTKGINYEGDEKALQEIVDYAQGRHEKGDYCPSAFVGHNDPLRKPDMAGFALPMRVGTAKTQHGEKPAVFGHLKIDNAKFEAIKSGKLPGVSPEIHRNAKKITGVALLDTEPPFNEFPLMTLGEEVKDLAAHFSAKEDPAVKTAEELQKELDEAKAQIAKFEAEKTEAANGSDDIKTTLASMQDSIGKLMKKTGLTIDTIQGKPTAMPAQPPEARMSMSPDDAAQFTALKNEVAELKAESASSKNDKAAAKLAAKAGEILADRIVSDEAKADIAKFAAEAASGVGGKDEKWFTGYVERLKPLFKAKPTGGSATSAMKAADVSDPVIAKFAKEGADLAQVAQFGAEYDDMKKSKQGRYIDFDKEHHIRTRLLTANVTPDGDNEDRG